MKLSIWLKLDFVGAMLLILFGFVTGHDSAILAAIVLLTMLGCVVEILEAIHKLKLATKGE